jgi:hypothetical protein
LRVNGPEAGIPPTMESAALIEIIDVPKRNYGYEKRQKELNRQSKREEKRQRKLERANEPTEEPRSDEPTPPVAPPEE